MKHINGTVKGDREERENLQRVEKRLAESEFGNEGTSVKGEVEKIFQRCERMAGIRMNGY